MKTSGGLRKHIINLAPCPSTLDTIISDCRMHLFDETETEETRFQRICAEHNMDIVSVQSRFDLYCRCVRGILSSWRFAMGKMAPGSDPLRLLEMALRVKTGEALQEADRSLLLDPAIPEHTRAVDVLNTWFYEHIDDPVWGCPCCVAY